MFHFPTDAAHSFFRNYTPIVKNQSRGSGVQNCYSNFLIKLPKHRYYKYNGLFDGIQSRNYQAIFWSTNQEIWANISVRWMSLKIQHKKRGAKEIQKVTSIIGCLDRFVAQIISNVPAVLWCAIVFVRRRFINIPPSCIHFPFYIFNITRFLPCHLFAQMFVFITNLFIRACQRVIFHTLHTNIPNDFVLLTEGL